MRRSYLWAVIATMTAALAGVIATSGSAKPSTKARTIVFIAKSAPGGFFPKGPPHPGSRFGFTDTVTGSDGSKGHDYVSCTVIVGKTALCQAQLALNTGQLAAQFPVNLSRRTNQFPVIGGTGAYDGARGTGTAKTVSKTTTKITVHLLP